MDERIFLIVVFNLDQSPENDFYKICFFLTKYGGGGRQRQLLAFSEIQKAWSRKIVQKG